MAEALDQPMNEEEELNIWSAFKQAAPNATTGQDEDALDKDRKTNSSSYKGSTLLQRIGKTVLTFPILPF